MYCLNIIYYKCKYICIFRFILKVLCINEENKLKKNMVYIVFKL